MTDKSSWEALSARQRLGRYATAVFAKWKAGGFVGAIGAAVGVVLSILDEPLPWWGWAFIVFAALITAQYQAFAEALAERELAVKAASARARAITEAESGAEPSPLAALAQLVTQGEALIDSLTSKPRRDHSGAQAEDLQPSIEAWAAKCRTLLREHWPSEAGTFDTTRGREFAEVWFYGWRTAQQLGSLRPRLGTLKSILIRAS